MKKTLLIAVYATAFLLLFHIVSHISAHGNGVEIDKILTSAESLFKTMKQRDYPGIWPLLSQKSKNTIIEDVRKELNKAGVVRTKEEINRDFATGGPLCKSYWDQYLAYFDPDTVLEHSSWDTGKVEQERAEIIVRYRKAERPAILKMYKQDGVWRMGLEETFRGSRR
ncbi:MAG TPA: hypothetical protein VMT62_18120 [Syntrophorhabdaceae bacterium]|nr:hypothetical protein [Syntrophorhabdaceae bacterium]